MPNAIRKCGLVAVLVISLTGCWLTPAVEEKESNANLLQTAREESLGPDVCKIQFWAAQAMAQANGRTSEQAVYDRAAWNLAQVRVAAILDKSPDVPEEQATAEVAKALQELYNSSDPPVECKTGK